MGHRIHFWLSFEHISQFLTMFNDCQISQSVSPIPCIKDTPECGTKGKERFEYALLLENSKAISHPQRLHSPFYPCHISLVLTTHTLWYHFCFPITPFQPPTQHMKCSPALAEEVGKGKTVFDPRTHS